MLKYYRVELKIAYAGVMFALKFHFVTLPSCVYQKMFGLDDFGIRQSYVLLSWFVFFGVYSLKSFNILLVHRFASSFGNGPLYN